MIITIDGPAASGKSAVAVELSRALGPDFRVLNTGVMYRAVGMICLDAGLLDSPDEMPQQLRYHTLDFDWSCTPAVLLLDAKPVDIARLHSPPVAEAASVVARNSEVRQLLIDQQRRIGAARGNLITEGRDQGSVVFTDAEYKFFLTAMVTVRAERRFEQSLRAWRLTLDDRSQGPAARPEYLETLHDLIRRDHRDTTSNVGRLVVPENAHVVDSTDVEGVHEVVARMLELMRR